MNNLTIAITIYFISFTYFKISQKIMYILTIKYYSIIRFIKEDKKAMIVLNKEVIRYRTFVRYTRIHVVVSSILATLNSFNEINLIMQIINISLIVLVIVTVIDLATINSRCTLLEEKVYNTHKNIL